MLLYVMLTGVFPFWRKEDEKMDRYRAGLSSPPSPSTLPPAPLTLQPEGL